MNGLNESYIYFSPGDLVTVRHNVDNKPVMWAVDKASRVIKHSTGDVETVFLGIKCRWFDKNGVLQENIFNTKDIMKVE